MSNYIKQQQQQQQLNDQTMKMNFQPGPQDKVGPDGQREMIDSVPPSRPNQQQINSSNISNQGLNKNAQMNMPGQMRDGTSPGHNMEGRHKLSTPERSKQGGNKPQIGQPSTGGNLGGRTPQRSQAVKADQMGGDARLSLKSQASGGGGGSPIRKKGGNKEGVAIGNMPTQKLAVGAQQMSSDRGPPTYRSMGEEDDLIQNSLGANMPAMNTGNPKFNPGMTGAMKDPKFQKPGMGLNMPHQDLNQMNMPQGGIPQIAGPGQGPNMQGKMGLDKARETGQMFGIKASGKKKPDLGGLGQMQGQVPGTALLDDDIALDYGGKPQGIEMGRMDIPQPHTRSGKKQAKLPDLKLGSSITGSVPDEKQKLIQIDSPKFRGSVLNNPNVQGRLPVPAFGTDRDAPATEGSARAERPPQRSMRPEPTSRPPNDDGGFAYEFLGRGQDTVVSSDIKKYTMQASEGLEYLPAQSTRKPNYEVEQPKKTEAQMHPVNESLHFAEPRDRATLDSAIFDFYAKNSFVRYIDGDEDPATLEQKLRDAMRQSPPDNLGETTIKDVRNVHISSDHQRAYVWVITTRKAVGSQVIVDTTRDLWLQVYSLSANWSSLSTISQEQNQKLQMLTSLRTEVGALQRKLDTGVKDKAKKEGQKLKELLKQRKALMQQFEMEIYKEMEMFNPMQKPDEDQESQCFHLVEHYQSVNRRDGTAGDEGVKAAKYFQRAQQSEFSVHLGSFEEPKLDYLSDPIQSFYKQFVSSEEALYFFKYETKMEKLLQDQIDPPMKQTPFGGSQPQNAPHSAISGTSLKTGVDSQSDAFSNQPIPTDKMPVLYKLSPYECRAERVMVNGNVIRLPFDAYSNQFAIVRALDPQLSRELSTIDNLMFAILKEVHVKQDEFSDDGTSSQINRRMSKNKRNQLQQRIIESRIEIYKANQADTTFGCNVDLKEVPAKLDPKNLSMAHRQDLDDDDSYKPVKKDFNFCCWYLIDQSNLSLNVAILLNEQMINMRTPFEYDSERVSIEEFNKRLVVAKNQRLKIDELDEVPFLEDYKISQNMPIYAIDLKEPTNFAKLPCFLKAANDAKLVWNRELLQNDQDPSKRFPPEKMMSPLQPQHQLQNLLEFQEQVFLNFDVPLERIYIILRQRPNDIDFEVLFPIVPDYLWASEDGLKIREEIDQIILHSYKKYLPEEPTQKSYKTEGVNKMLYSEQYNQAFQNKGDHEKTKQYSRESTSLQRVVRPGSSARKRWTKDSVRQCVSFHHIFLKKINDVHEGKERNTALQQMSPHIFAEETLHQYGLAHFQCTWEAMKGIVNQKSLKMAKTAQHNVLVEEQAESGASKSAGRGRVRSTRTMRKQANSTQQQIEELAAEIKSPRSSKSDALQSPRALSTPRTILVAGGLKEPKDHEGLKVKFQFEKMCVCEGLRNFVHIIKYKKRHSVKRNNLGEVIRILYKGQYYAFEEDFEFFDYEIVIGQLDVSLRQHSVNVNEERDPLKRTQQILAQYEHYDGIFTPLQNPYTPYQQLVMSYDIDSLKEEERLSRPNRQRPQKEPLKIMQVCQKQTTYLVADPDNEELCQLKSLPAEFAFQEFLHNGDFRKEYFEAQLLQVSNIRQVRWVREKPDAFPLQDYLPEQSMTKIWVPSPSSEFNSLFNIKNVDVWDLISRHGDVAKYIAKAPVVLDSRLEPLPQNYALLRNLLLDDMTLTTVKQMRSNPRNVVFALRQKREVSMAQEVNQNGTASDKTMAVYMVGQLDEYYENLRYLWVIRQQAGQREAQEEYAKRKRPLQQATNVLEIYSFAGFAVEWAAANSKLSLRDPRYGKWFEECYKNCRMMAFDPNFGDSIDPNAEVFAVRMWKPLNAVKIFSFNFEACQLQEIYEIPVSGDLLVQLQNIQLVRVSDVKQTYALLLDWCSVKEIFLIEFTSRRLAAKAGQLPQNVYKGSLVGKYDFICPNLAEAQYFSGGERIFVPNLQVKMVPLYKQFDPKDDNVDYVGESRQLTRDGFSLIYDQGRVDFDYQYFSNLVGHKKIELHLQYSANVFEYEHRITEKMKRNLNKESEVDSKFFQALIIKVRFRKEILQSAVYSENEKLKMLTYFSKTIQGHRNLDYSMINERIAKIGIRVDIFRNQDCGYFLQPRSELYGANLLTFLDDDLELVERVLQRQLESVRANKKSLINLGSQALVMPFLPNISGSMYSWQKHQYDFFTTRARFCELDMNLMSPIGWALYHKCHNTVKLYVDYFRNLSRISSREEIGDHSVIFYSCIKQLLELGSIELAEFLDPDGVGEDIGCELFQQTLKDSYLPQFEASVATFTNEYKRSIHTLERNMQQALMIDEIQSAKRAFEDGESPCAIPASYEVQYGLIDLGWVNVLNVFDQQPIHRCLKRQRASRKSAKGAPQEFDWASELKRHKQRAMPLISYINSEKNLDTYKYQSIKLLIDHYWAHQSYDFFKTQFFIFLVFFVFPFGVDLYYLKTVTLPHGDVTAAQVLFGFLALACHVVFFMSELIQMRSTGKNLRIYFGDCWNFNDFFCLPVYLAALITAWSWAGAEDPVAGRAAIQVLYMVVICQTFVKLLFLMRIFEPVSFMLLLVPKIIGDLGPFFVFTFLANVLFAALFMVLEVELSNEYTLLFPPLKWLIFTLRNGLHDFQIDETDGFLQHYSNQADAAALSDGKGAILYLSWLVWIANTLLVTIILFSLIISIIGQSYEQVLGDAEARLYRQKAELIIECQQVLLKLGYLQPSEVQATLLIRKKKFADDISERLNMEKWSGMTQSLKMFMQFNVIAQLEAQGEQYEGQSHQLNAQLARLQKSLNEVQRRQRAAVAYSRHGEPDPFDGGEHGDMMDVDKSKITYDPSLNNISH